MNKLLDLCSDVIERAARAGAQAAECWGERLRQTAVHIEQNEVKGASISEHEGIGLRVFVDHRTGYAYANRLTDDAIDEAITDAIAIARASPGDPANVLAEKSLIRPIGGLFDAALAEMPADECVRLAAELVTEARKADKRVSIDNGSVGVGDGESALASSTGIRAWERDAAASWGLFGMAIDGDEVGSFDHIYQASRRRADIDVNKLGADFGQRVTALLGARDGTSYRGKVLFSPEAFEEVFLDPLFEAIDGDAALRGRSRLAQKLGTRIAAPGFTLVDDGTVPGALSSSSFDREGTPHRRTVLVGDGVLHTFLYDVKTAHRAQRRPTGHASGSARQMPHIQRTNVALQPGDASEEALLQDLGSGLFVSRFSGDVDAVSGDFSGVAKGSFLVRRGKKVAPVKETLIAGNIFDALGRIVGIGDTPHVNMSTSCPWILVDGIDVTAGGA